MTDFATRTSERYYRCYLIKDQHIVGHEAIFRPDDDAAIEKARQVLETSNFLQIEVWSGAQRIASIAKDDSFSVSIEDPPLS
jgi:hypothetical protein